MRLFVADVTLCASTSAKIQPSAGRRARAAESRLRSGAGSHLARSLGFGSPSPPTETAGRYARERAHALGDLTTQRLRWACRWDGLDWHQFGNNRRLRNIDRLKPPASESS